MFKYRLRFSKTGAAVWISHLDTMQVIRRAFRRCELQLRHSEGFNPHPIMSLALPLSVGVGSECELLDFETLEKIGTDTVLQLNEKLPEGIRAVSIAIPGRKFAEIKWIAVTGELIYSELPDIGSIAELFRSEVIMVTKKTKHGFGEYNLAEHIKNTRVSTDGTSITIKSIISAQEPTINPAMLVQALPEKPQEASWRRLALYTADMAEFI